MEPTFVEVRRRTKVIGRFPRGDLGAVARLGRARLSSRGWRGVVMTPKTVAEVERLRRHREHSPSTDAKEVVAA